MSSSDASPAAPPTRSAKVPIGFIIAVFVAAAAVGGVILYFGLHGQLGGPIP